MLVCKRLANKTLTTSFGNITFNKDGQNDDLSPDKQEVLGKLSDIDYIKEEQEASPNSNKKTPSKKNDDTEVKEEVKEEVKTEALVDAQPEEVKEELEKETEEKKETPKKRTPQKRTPRKSTKKSEE